MPGRCSRAAVISAPGIVDPDINRNDRRVQRKTIFVPALLQVGCPISANPPVQHGYIFPRITMAQPPRDQQRITGTKRSRITVIAAGIRNAVPLK
ncbi:hypothetical protein D3C77_707170 [compost metagenome]